MANFRCKLALENDRYVQVSQWQGEWRVDIREWKNNEPTKKGISLTLMSWKNLINQLEYLDKALENREYYQSHLGGNVYCKLYSVCVDLRQYWKPEEEVVPTKKGICLKPIEYKLLKKHAVEIGKVLPELDAIVPCYLQSDHMNQIGALQCPECNPNDFGNW